MSVRRRKTAEGGRGAGRNGGLVCAVARAGGASGGQVGHNARLFVIGLIFITLNIKEPEGRLSVRVTEFNSNKSIHASLQRKPEEMSQSWLI